MSALTEAQAVLPEQDPSLVTTRELADLLGCNISTAERKADLLVTSGKAERGEKLIRMVNGGIRKVSAWRLLK